MHYEPPPPSTHTTTTTATVRRHASTKHTQVREIAFIIRQTYSFLMVYPPHTDTHTDPAPYCSVPTPREGDHFFLRNPFHRDMCVFQKGNI